ncbi:HK97 gp10 family phage protein [Dialister invisus]|uniref:HK97 gp10 family phage protein n=1 Tax=Dialister invisus TaxID=218538 RepID=UPI0026762204|nr:HK97 gp10 family phage protein [Dialister invisus]
MAKVQVKMPEEFLLRLSRLGDKTDEIIPKVLEAGGEVVEQKVRANLSAVIGRDTKEESRSTGELLSALGVTPAKIDRDGNYNVKVGFSEPRPDGRSNAMIANVLEYGKSGQPAKPFLKPARTAARAPCIEAMKAAFEREVEKL